MADGFNCRIVYIQIELKFHLFLFWCRGRIGSTSTTKNKRASLLFQKHEVFIDKYLLSFFILFYFFIISLRSSITVQLLFSLSCLLWVLRRFVVSFHFILVLIESHERDRARTLFMTMRRQLSYVIRFVEREKKKKLCEREMPVSLWTRASFNRDADVDEKTIQDSPFFFHLLSHSFQKEIPVFFIKNVCCKCNDAHPDPPEGQTQAQARD